MQTQILQSLLDTQLGQRADEILRKCVHCGFCTATCPTYQLLGDELDGPRGRIYQVKLLLEGHPADRETLMHLDRCLTCRSCETTCPSGVDYSELIDMGRGYIESQDLRPWGQKFVRSLLGALLPYPSRHRLILKTASFFRPLMPAFLKEKAPLIRSPENFNNVRFSTKAESSQKSVLLLDGCAQSTLSPNTNTSAELVLRALGYRVVREPSNSCCGAVNHHLNQQQQTEQWVLKNLQQWQQLNKVEDLDAIVSTATGCGVMLKDYPTILKHLDVEVETHQNLLDKICDISELLNVKALQKTIGDYQASPQTIGFHAPCTLTHGHRLADQLAQKLNELGYQLQTPENAHMCCGSAGTYSLLQPELSKQLRSNKIEALAATGAQTIITANVGCEHHLNSAADIPVIHWIELLARDIQRSANAT